MVASLPWPSMFPGTAGPQVDSHHALPKIDAGLEALTRHDLVPFRALSDVFIAMTGHLVLTDIDPDAPVTTSSRAIGQVIRGEIGFDGLLVSDDLSMSALTGSLAERTTAACAAGCDLVVHCNGAMAEMEAVADAAPELSGPSLRRAERVVTIGRQLAADRHDIDRDRARALLAVMDGDGRYPGEGV